MGSTKRENNAFMNSVLDSLFRPSALGKRTIGTNSPESFLATHALASLGTLVLGIILLHNGIILGERHIQTLIGSGYPFNWQTGIAFVISFALLLGIHAFMLWAVSTVLAEQKLSGIRMGTGIVLYLVLSFISVLLLSWMDIASPYDVMPFLILIPLLVSFGIPLLFSILTTVFVKDGGEELSETIEEATAFSFTPILVMMPAFMALTAYSIIMDRPGGMTVFICAMCILVQFFAASITTPALAAGAVWTLISQYKILKGTRARKKIIAIHAALLAAGCIAVFLLTRMIFYI